MLSRAKTHLRRRTVLATAAAVGSSSLLGSFERLLASIQPRVLRSRPLVPVEDSTTGLKLLELPDGFRCLSFGWTGDPLDDQSPTPGAHDGMAVIADNDGLLTICRNHELGGSGPAFGSAQSAYDRLAPGGCTNMVFDSRRGEWKSAFSSLSGTVKNCAGGATPWGTWLTCEETVVEDGDKDDDDLLKYEQPHGYIFEVPAAGAKEAIPLKAMGRFVHEAVAVDPSSGIVYETEDRKPAGFYRFLPAEPGRLAAGGRLQMMKIAGGPDLIRSASGDQTYDVSWVDIAEPDRRHSPGTKDRGGVYQQGAEQGGSAFQKLEGCWWGNDQCYFVASHGGRSEKGQIWAYHPASETLKLVFESPGSDVLDCPDNLCVSPRGGLLLCEDGDRVPQKLHVLSTDGRIAEFARNGVQLNGERSKHRGDYRGSEWCGAAFSPDGKWLFVNLQNPGITFAITGEWESVGL